MIIHQSNSTPTRNSSASTASRPTARKLVLPRVRRRPSTRSRSGPEQHHRDHDREEQQVARPAARGRAPHGLAARRREPQVRPTVRTPDQEPGDIAAAMPPSAGRDRLRRTRAGLEACSGCGAGTGQPWPSGSAEPAGTGRPRRRSGGASGAGTGSAATGGGVTAPGGSSAAATGTVSVRVVSTGVGPDWSAGAGCRRRGGAGVASAGASASVRSATTGSSSDGLSFPRSSSAMPRSVPEQAAGPSRLHPDGGVAVNDRTPIRRSGSGSWCGRADRI